MFRAVLTHGLGVHRTMRTLHESVRQQFGAFGTERQVLTSDLFKVEAVECNRLEALVVILTIHANEQRQRAQVFAEQLWGIGLASSNGHTGPV